MDRRAGDEWIRVKGINRWMKREKWSGGREEGIKINE